MEKKLVKFKLKSEKEYQSGYLQQNSDFIDGFYVETLDGNYKLSIHFVDILSEDDNLTTQLSGLTDLELELDEICDNIINADFSLERIKILKEYLVKYKLKIIKNFI